MFLLFFFFFSFSSPPSSLIPASLFPFLFTIFSSFLLHSLPTPVIPIVFTVDSIITTDDQPAVEACLEVDNELVDENVAYRIPIAVETQDGTARKKWLLVFFQGMNTFS